MWPKTPALRVPFREGHVEKSRTRSWQPTGSADALFDSHSISGRSFLPLLWDVFWTAVSGLLVLDPHTEPESFHRIHLIDQYCTSISSDGSFFSEGEKNRRQKRQRCAINWMREKVQIVLSSWLKRSREYIALSARTWVWAEASCV